MLGAEERAIEGAPLAEVAEVPPFEVFPLQQAEADEGLLREEDLESGWPELDPPEPSSHLHPATTSLVSAARDERSSIESVKTDEVLLLERKSEAALRSSSRSDTVIRELPMLRAELE